jgi:hypothetical protein
LLNVASMNLRITMLFGIVSLSACAWEPPSMSKDKEDAGEPDAAPIVTEASTSDGGDGGEDAASDAEGGQASSPAAEGSACLEAGGDCSQDPHSCCNNTTCIEDSEKPGRSVCAANCLENDQCGSGCCSPLSAGTGKVCSPVGFCESTCKKSGESCATTADCCGAMTCYSNGSTSRCES